MLPLGTAALRGQKSTNRPRLIENYDPVKAPKFSWPPRLKHASAVIRAKAEARDKAANEGDKR